MMKRRMVLLPICFMIFALAACGDNPSPAQSGKTSQEDGGQTGAEVPEAEDSVQTNTEASQEEEDSTPYFSVPTQADPPAIGSGINMVNIVPEGCTEVVYDGGVYLFKMSSMPTGETLVNFINELLIPQIRACSDTGTCLVKDPSSNDVLGLGRGVIPFRAFDSFGYRISDSGIEYVYWIIDGEQFANEWQLSEGMKLLDVRYVYDGVLYDAITRVREEEQAISVTPFEEPNQSFEIIE